MGSIVNGIKGFGNSTIGQAAGVLGVPGVSEATTAANVASPDAGSANIAQQAAANQQAQQQQQKAVTNAQNFRANLPNYEQDQQNTATDAAKAKLANTMSGIDSSANSRGLLYSGLKQGAQANAAGGYASDLAATKANINQNSEAAAEGMENSAVGNGLNQQQIMQQQNDAAYQQALAAQQQKFGMLGSAITGAGKVGGLILGG